ncbi:hypothetical protein [Nonomuraea aurantiaca]|uniref:hypothetical protein n=1 Tax=Nonomuraea aurantiaca TaxID=2878562 RepID=UPI001CDA4B26|nr:hypothetical protein [Nonomuraea aurantiaca]MCA2224113.1 hypothetical protein [Nonomuraea aurantiaca]
MVGITHRVAQPRVRKGVLVVHVIASVALLGEVWGLVVLNTVATGAIRPWQSCGGRVL